MEVNVTCFDRVAGTNWSTVTVEGVTWSDYLILVTFPVNFVGCVFGSVLILIITSRRVSKSNDGQWYLKDAIISALAVSDMIGM